ncbi:hypothetical protein JG687_00016640, partial [Phytophthora cactorum]
IVLLAAEQGHFEVVCWLCEHTVEEEEKYDETYDEVMKHVLKFGDDDLTKFLLPPGRCVLDYAKNCPRVEVIEMMLDCGYLRRDAEAAASAIRDFAAEDCSQRGYWSNRLIGSCFGALVDSCKGGKLETVQWLHQYPICLRAIELLKSGQCYADPITEAAGEGHWEIVQYLCDQEIAKDYDEALKRAIRNGHQRPRIRPIDFAARCGRLEVVQFLRNFNPQDQRGSESSRNDAWWSQSQNSILLAADKGHLELVKWLHANRYESCAEHAMDAAARAGHLPVVKWLHFNRSEGCTAYAMHFAAVIGHLSLVQWLHSNRDEGCAKAINTMDWVARAGHLDVAKWLDANKLDECSDGAIKEVFRNGPLRVASWLHSWLHSRFPDQTPVGNLQKIQERLFVSTNWKMRMQTATKMTESKVA